MSDRLAIIAALLAALAASRSIAAEPERLIDITNWGVGDWVFAFIAVSWFLGDLTTGRANAARGAIARRYGAAAARDVRLAAGPRLSP
jgi:hypothetical protein